MIIHVCRIGERTSARCVEPGTLQETVYSAHRPVHDVPSHPGGGTSPRARQGGSLRSGASPQVEDGDPALNARGASATRIVATGRTASLGHSNIKASNSQMRSQEPEHLPHIKN